MTRGILDSSPIRGPPKPRMEPLKRTASTASLPTPPRTVVKRKRGQSRASTRASSDEDQPEALDEEEDVRMKGRALFTSLDAKEPPKKGPHSRGEAKLEGADNENPFWETENATKAGMSSIQEDEEEEGGDEEDSGLLTSKAGKARLLVSPPPSHRQMAVPPKTPSRRKEDRTIARLPTRATQARGSRLVLPSRDSPENPFLEEFSPSPEDLTEPRTPTPTPPGPLEEPETTTWVFRGVRRAYANPHYEKSKETAEHAKLPLHHRDYSPDPTEGAVQLLFPEEHAKRALRRSPRIVAATSKATTSKLKTRRDADDEWASSDEEREKEKEKLKTPPKKVEAPKPPPVKKLLRQKSSATLDRMIGKPTSSSSQVSITDQRRTRMTTRSQVRH